MLDLKYEENESIYHQIIKNSKFGSKIKIEFNNENEERPNFLPMVPWYSGTSADLMKMFFDLIVTLKLFLGRFDMRAMLVCKI